MRDRYGCQLLAKGSCDDIPWNDRHRRRRWQRCLGPIEPHGHLEEAVLYLLLFDWREDFRQVERVRHRLLLLKNVLHQTDGSSGHGRRQVQAQFVVGQNVDEQVLEPLAQEPVAQTSTRLTLVARHGAHSAKNNLSYLMSTWSLTGLNDM